MLEINVKKTLGELRLEADLQIPAQGVTAVFGLSGSGKTSLINMISGLLAPDSGFIRLNGKTLVDTARHINLAPNKRRIGYVFQDARLFPHYRVKGNLVYGMKKKSAVDFRQVLHLLGIESLLKRYPSTLSGGEKQRVAIGRALLSEPEILLMDEPLSALDLPRKQELLAYLQTLSREIRLPILYITHSLSEIKALAQRIILLDNGKVTAYGDTRTVLTAPQLTRWREEKTDKKTPAL